MRVVVMGVTGCGKSSVGEAVADRLGCVFADADDFHSPADVATMAQGIALTDEQRWPWLDAVGEWMRTRDNAVVACSALRRTHRDRLRDAAGPAVFVHLTAPQETIETRVRNRMETDGHFAGVELVSTQYAVLEPLGSDEVGGTIDVTDINVADAASHAVVLVLRLQG